MNVLHPVLQHEPDSAEADHSDDLPKDDTSDEVTSAQEDVKKAPNAAPMQKRRRVTRACDEVSLHFLHRSLLSYLALCWSKHQKHRGCACYCAAIILPSTVCPPVARGVTLYSRCQVALPTTWHTYNKTNIDWQHVLATIQTSYIYIYA